MGDVAHQLGLGHETLLCPLGAHRGGNHVEVGCAVACPAFIGRHVFGSAGIDAGEQHVEVAHCLVFGLLHFAYIAVGLRGIVFYDTRVAVLHVVYGVAVLVAHVAVDNAGAREAVVVHHHIVVAAALGIFFLQKCLGEHRAVEQRTVAVLLAVEVGGEGEHVVGGVLIHGSGGGCADEKQGIR